MSKVRIYDLAKELKLDNKKVIEEVRRFGYDVSVPSNSVPPDIAEKVKSKYFPQKAQTLERRVKLIKHRGDEIAGQSSMEQDIGGQMSPSLSNFEEPIKPQPSTNQPQLVKKITGVNKLVETPILTPETPTPVPASQSSQAPTVVKVVGKTDSTAVQPQLQESPQQKATPVIAPKETRENEDSVKQRVVKIEPAKVETPIVVASKEEPPQVEVQQKPVPVVEVAPVEAEPVVSVVVAPSPVEKEEVEVKPEIKVAKEQPALEPSKLETKPIPIPAKPEFKTRPILNKFENKTEPNRKPENKPEQPVKTEIKPIIVERPTSSFNQSQQVNKAKPQENTFTRPNTGNVNRTQIIPLQAPAQGQDQSNRKPHQMEQQNRQHHRSQPFNRPQHQQGQHQQGQHQQGQHQQGQHQQGQHQQNQRGPYTGQQQRPHSAPGGNFKDQENYQQNQKPQFQKPSPKGVTQVLHRVNTKAESEILDAQRTTYIPPPDSRKKSRRPTPGNRPAHGKKEEREMREKLPNFQPPPTVAITPKVVIPKEVKAIKLVEGTTVKEFAEKLEVKPKDVVALLLSKGVMATINQTLNADVVREIGRDFGVDVSFVEFEEMTTETEFEEGTDRGEELETRAPVVTVMGHVDHGKTSLLDAIRKTRVAEGEAGGITQHIGAYSVYVADPDNPQQKRRVVFLDTPGHEAFTMMRARGAKVTDVVILVVAADDGVMPQTIEAIEHAKAAGVPIVVAINKVDKPQAQPDRVKQALSDYGLVWDGWGGDTVMVEVSAKHRINLNGLLEMILLTADILDLKADSKRLGSGIVLEAKLDKGRGAVATVLVQTGTLKVGDPVIAGLFFGRVRAMFDETGASVQSVGPATPVEVLGLQGVPSAGDQFQVVNDIAKAVQITQLRQSKKRMLELSRSSAQKLEDLFSAMQAGKLKELLIILKTDVQGSVEVLKETLQKLSTDKVKVRVIRSGVGAITESDVLLASASKDMEHTAVIIGFNVRPEQRAEEIARMEKVDIRLHSIIYKVEEEIRDAMIGMLEATVKEVALGKARIDQVIKIPKAGNIAGVIVTEGVVKRTGKVRLIRDSVLIYEGQITSLRRFKDDVSEVKQGFECGIGIDKYSDIKVGDILEVYTTEKVTPTEL